MDNPGRQIYPPLRIWFYLFIVALLIPISLYFIDRLRTQYEYNSRSAYLTHGFDTAGGRPVVLFLGTSLLECGVDSSRKIETCVRDLSGKQIVLLKVFRRASTLADIVYHTKSLGQVQPNLVVVEANMLFYRSAQEPVLTKYLDLFRSVITLDPMYKPYFPDARPVFRVIRKTVNEGRNGLVDSFDISSFRELAARWQSKGTHFLLINFPIEDIEEFKKWNSADTSTFRFNLQYLREKIKLDYFNAKLKLNAGFFYDHTHLNQKGNNIFSQSFCRELALEIKSL
ncbi:MAG TPA: hypothetical protein VMH01_06660 [Puia sp.]|nr:hypothetical protein [Puia sp.]